ncbi:MAG TPA: metal-dependent hydrolase, partial [Clostridia bacterium]|nr:metal-dependent hydrolase [Clostridia bacterium]
PIGDFFTMGPEDAVKAAEMIAPEYVIPMHYNTFPVIKQDPEEFKKAVEEKGICKVKVLNPGQTLEL